MGQDDRYHHLANADLRGRQRPSGSDESTQRDIAQGKPYTSYAQIDDFFGAISKRLLQKYGRDR